MEQIVLATGNKGKIREFSEAFSHLSIDCVPVKEVVTMRNLRKQVPLLWKMLY